MGFVPVVPPNRSSSGHARWTRRATAGEAKSSGCFRRRKDWRRRFTRYDKLDVSSPSSHCGGAPQFGFTLRPAAEATSASYEDSIPRALMHKPEPCKIGHDFDISNRFGLSELRSQTGYQQYSPKRPPVHPSLLVAVKSSTMGLNTTPEIGT